MRVVYGSGQSGGSVGSLAKRFFREIKYSRYRGVS